MLGDFTSISRKEVAKEYPKCDAESALHVWVTKSAPVFLEFGQESA